MHDIKLYTATQNKEINTPCEWIIALARGRLPHQYYTQKMIIALLGAKSQANERMIYFLDYMLKEKLQNVLVGRVSSKFIQDTNIYLDKWVAPYTREKIKVISDIVITFDKDLREDKMWPTLVMLLEEITQQLPESEREEVDVILKQILIGYRNYTVHQTFFHKQEREESYYMYKLNDLRYKELLYLLNECIASGSEEDLYDQMTKKCLAALEKEVDSLITFSKHQCKKGNHFLRVVLHLQSQINILKRTPEYEFLSAELREKMLQKAEIFLDNLNAVMNKLHLLFKTICEQAKPGFVVEDVIAIEINRLVNDPVFSAILDLGAEAIAHHINSPENIRWVHEAVMETRCNVCKPFLLDKRGDFATLKVELKKATNYRVRRNIIERLFQVVLDDEILFPRNAKSIGAQITQDQEECLLMLQHEFIHALHRQIETMLIEEAVTFLENFRCHPLILPLPKTAPFAKRNSIAQHEFDYLIEHCHSNVMKHVRPKESPMLHHIDCPIEQDILGEATKRMVDAIQYRQPGWDSFNVVMDITEKTYKKLLKPDFKCDSMLEDFVTESKHQNKWISFLREEKNIPLRLERMIELYYFVRDKAHFKASDWIVTKLHIGMTEQEKTIQALQTLYLQSVEELIVQRQHQSDHEKNLMFERVLYPSLGAELFNNTICPRINARSKQALEKLMEGLV